MLASDNKSVTKLNLRDALKCKAFRKY